MSVFYTYYDLPLMVSVIARLPRHTGTLTHVSGTVDAVVVESRSL